MKHSGMDGSRDVRVVVLRGRRDKAERSRRGPLFSWELVDGGVLT